MERLLEWLVLPPTGPLLLAATGLLFARRRWGTVLTGTGLALLYLASIPAVAIGLAGLLQDRHDAVSDPGRVAETAEAIVVLGGGHTDHPPEYSNAAPDRFTLVRLRYAAWLQRRTGLPLAVSAGGPEGTEPGATAMRHALERDMGATVRWTEDRSRNTWENARFTADLLKRDGLETVAVVTHAVHMPRALESFQAAGLEAVPAPTGFITAGLRDRGLWALLPRASTLMSTQLVLHEMLGYLWYRLRYF